jgi:hypothetical protein
MLLTFSTVEANSKTTKHYKIIGVKSNIIFLVMKTNLLHYLSLIYFITKPLQVSGMCCPSAGGIITFSGSAAQSGL